MKKASEFYETMEQQLDSHLKSIEALITVCLDSEDSQREFNKSRIVTLDEECGKAIRYMLDTFTGSSTDLQNMLYENKWELVTGKNFYLQPTDKDEKK